MNSGDNVDLGTNLAWRVLSRPKQCAFQLALNMYLKVADHSFGGTSSSPTAAEYDSQREKQCPAGARNCKRSVLSQSNTLVQLTHRR